MPNSSVPSKDVLVRLAAQMYRDVDRISATECPTLTEDTGLGSARLLGAVVAVVRSNKLTTWLSEPTATRASQFRPWRAARSGKGSAQWMGNCASTVALEGGAGLVVTESATRRLNKPDDA